MWQARQHGRRRSVCGDGEEVVQIGEEVEQHGKKKKSKSTSCRTRVMRPAARESLW
jgi:hypothetical protein